MFAKLRLIFATIIYLKPIQVRYQLYYKVRNKFISPLRYASLKGYNPPARSLIWPNEPLYGKGLAISVSSDRKVKFTFLNQSQCFDFNRIDWNFCGHGKLWTYNLNYFEFLFHPNLSKEDALGLIKGYVQNLQTHKDGLEPYPTSLRIINWVKFLSRNAYRDEYIDQSLYKQFILLNAHLEYHILANHLLENAFALLFGVCYFRNERLYDKVVKLLRAQLEEQILNDGAHYERSVMYHQIILFRLLDSISLLKYDDWKSKELLPFLEVQAVKMLNWLAAITISQKNIPMVKDAAPGIAPDNEALFTYAQGLGLTWGSSVLSDSGYRLFKKNGLQMMADAGSVAPSYQPGHAHADEGNFLVWDNQKPIIVDTGISTYNKNLRRQQERETASHNCVFIEGYNSSQVWGGFRVARRAEVKIAKDIPGRLEISHNGFKKLGVKTARIFGLEEQGFFIEDTYTCHKQECKMLRMHLHFHPSLEVQVCGEKVFAGSLSITLSGFYDIALEDYMFAARFNELKKAKRLKLFPKSQTRISIHYAS